MARKNERAGQPNRVAQMRRRAERFSTEEKYRRVLGPGSKDLLRTRITHVAQEKVPA